MSALAAIEQPCYSFPLVKTPKTAKNSEHRHTKYVAASGEFDGLRDGLISKRNSTKDRYAIFRKFYKIASMLKTKNGKIQFVHKVTWPQNLNGEKNEITQICINQTFNLSHT